MFSKHGNPPSRGGLLTGLAPNPGFVRVPIENPKYGAHAVNKPPLDDGLPFFENSSDFFSIAFMLV